MTLTEEVRSGTFFEKQRRKQKKECKLRGERRHGRSDGKQRRRERKPRAGALLRLHIECVLKNTAHHHVSKRRRNARKTQRNGGITPKKHFDTTHRRISHRIPSVSRETAKKQAKSAFLNVRSKKTALRHPNTSSSEHLKHYLSAYSSTLRWHILSVLCRCALIVLCRYAMITACRMFRTLLVDVF